MVITARREQWLNEAEQYLKSQGISVYSFLDRAEAVVAGTTPMGRIGKPGELAPTVLFLASEGASYITGQVVPIDGGRTAQ